MNLVKKLQEQQKVLENIRREKKLELEKNVGVKNYLLSLQNKWDERKPALYYIFEKVTE